MKKILNLHKPLIKYSPCYGAAFSLMDQTDENLAWLINNFAYLYAVESKKSAISSVVGGLSIFANFLYGNELYHSYWGIKTQVISREVFDKYFSDFTSFCRDMILEESCVFTFVNFKYIPKYDCEIDYLHPIFISGFDDEEQVFYVSDFFGLEYRKEKVSYQNLEKSYINVKIEKLPHEDYLNGITLYQKIEYPFQKCSTEQNIETIIQMIRWLVIPTCYRGVPFSKEKVMYAGMDAQIFLCDYIYQSLLKKPENAHHKWMALIVEHKRIVHLGIKYLEKLNILTTDAYMEYKNIYERYEKILIKYTYMLVKNQDKSSLKEIFGKTEELILEMKTLTEIEKRYYIKVMRNFE